jgi:hypothetical protein
MGSGGADPTVVLLPQHKCWGGAGETEMSCCGLPEPPASLPVPSRPFPITVLAGSGRWLSADDVTAWKHYTIENLKVHWKRTLWLRRKL